MRDLPFFMPTFHFYQAELSSSVREKFPNGLSSQPFGFNNKVLKIRKNNAGILCTNWKDIRAI
jgi:hypothetical protein